MPMLPFITAKMLAGIALGGVGGFFWYRYVGCATGTCPITSNPYLSIAYGMLMGGVITA